MTEIVREVQEAEWREYVEGVAWDICYTPEWTRFLELTFGFPRHHLYAIDRSGAITGFLPLFHVTSRITGNRLCAAPFTHHCGPLGSVEDRAALLSAACRVRDDLGKGSLEIREKVDRQGFPAFTWYSTYVLDLTPGAEPLRKQRFSKNIQRGISQAERLGVEVVTSRRAEDIAAFYRLNLHHKKELGVLCHPRRFFDNLFSLLPEHATLYTARYHDETVAGCIILRYRNHYLYGYGASRTSSRDIPALKRILWESITDACASGGQSFDFGRVSYDNAGLIQFKKSWGAEERKLYYSYYPALTTNVTNRRDTLLFRVGNAVLRAMPVPLFTLLSEQYFGSFG